MNKQPPSADTFDQAAFDAELAANRKYAARLSDKEFASLVSYADSFNCSTDEFFAHLSGAIDDMLRGRFGR